MGKRVRAKCLKCGERFEFDDGGGFLFHLLRCDRCGKTKSIGFDDIPELHARYIKGLPGPYSVVSAEHDRRIQQDPTIRPISEEEYRKGVEEFAGLCSCKGRFRFDAPPRCPKCRSTDVERGQTTMYYD